MTMPQPPESQSAAPRRIGRYRYSVAGFLIALVGVFIGIPFLEQFDKDKHIEVILMEANTGTLYVAVLISRLVALYSSEKLQLGAQKH
jgi:hypothetical protein